MALSLTSTEFVNGERISDDYTSQGRDLSPPLKWTDVPEGTRSFALIVDDPDAPRGDWVHWLVYNIPAEERELSEGIAHQESFPNGILQGTNDFGKIGYGGPAPPPGKTHHYAFTLYALDTPLPIPAAATKTTLLRAMQKHILDKAHLVGTYAS